LLDYKWNYRLQMKFKKKLKIKIKYKYILSNEFKKDWLLYSKR
jgi:hypothetical protein